MNSTISVETQMRFHSNKHQQVLNSRQPNKKKKKNTDFLTRKEKCLPVTKPTLNQTNYTHDSNHEPNQIIRCD